MRSVYYGIKDDPPNEKGGSRMNENYNEYIPYDEDNENYLKRNILKLSAQMKNDVSLNIESREILEKVQAALLDLNKKTSDCGCNRLSDALRRTFDDIDITMKTKSPVRGISCGFSIIDISAGGFRPSDFIVIYGNEEIQYLTLSMAAHICLFQNKPTAYFSLGKSDIFLIKIMLCRETEVKYGNLNCGLLNSKDFCSIVKTAGKITDAPFYIFDEPDMSILDIYTQAVKLKNSKNIEIIFIDNFNLIHTQNYTFISKIIKRLTRELAIPIVVLYDNSAKVSDFSFNNADLWKTINRDADMIIGLKGSNNEKRTLCLEKNRYGRTGGMKIDYDPSCLKFFETSMEV